MPMKKTLTLRFNTIYLLVVLVWSQPFLPVHVAQAAGDPIFAGAVAQQRLLEEVVEQMRMGKLTPQEAWDKGNLIIDDVIQVLNQSGDWIVGKGTPEGEMYRALAKLLIEHGPERLVDAGELPPRVRLWLSDGFKANKDARAVDWAESVLSEVKKPMLRENAMAIQAIEALARYYDHINDAQKSLDVWLRAKNTFYADKPSWWMQSALLEAARRYVRLGDEDKARQFYAQVADYGAGWLAGLALYDQAELLENQGKHAEARKLLDQPVTGEDADAMRVLFQTQIAHSYYAAGDWENAGLYSQKAIDAYKALKQPVTREGVDNHVLRARSYLELSRQWIGAPFVCESGEIHMIVPRGKPLNTTLARLLVRSPGTVDLAVSIDDARLKASVSKGASLGGITQARSLAVWLAPQLQRNGVPESFEAILTVTCAQDANFKAKVLVYVDVKDMTADEAAKVGQPER